MAPEDAGAEAGADADVDVDAFFAARRVKTAAFLDTWSASFDRHLQADGRAALGADGCVYAVGSAGRGELGRQSDLDVFLVTHGAPRRVDEMLVQVAILRAGRELSLPDPSNDGSFLRLYAADDLKERLGDSSDDVENTFTARMLLLLESRALHGAAAYERLVRDVVQTYWRNADYHADDYLPIVVANDIVRYWRAVLLNYEAKWARKRRAAAAAGRLTAELDAEQRLDGYKLRFARCMTCYSMLARLLAEATPAGPGAPAHVAQEAFIEMVRATPVERLQQVRALAGRRLDPGVAATIDEILALYRAYLEEREAPREALVRAFRDETRRRQLFKASGRFGEAVFALVQRVGAGSPLYRYVVT
jgi:hypothetical protein